MATTTPEVFSGTPSIDADKAAHIYDLYVSALGDEDKAGDMESAAYYEGQSGAFYYALTVIYGYDPEAGETP